MSTTPAKISTHIKKLCRKIGTGWAPQWVPVEPRLDSGFRDCFADVGRQVEEHGGSLVSGWLIWEHPGVLLDAEFHAIWKSPEGNLLDVTEKADRERRVLFVPDGTRTFAGHRIDNVRLPIGKDPLIAEFIKSKELFQQSFEAEHAEKVGMVALSPELTALQYESDRLWSMVLANQA
jgi:hypothetical protein